MIRRRSPRTRGCLLHHNNPVVIPNCDRFAAAYFLANADAEVRRFLSEDQNSGMEEEVAKREREYSLAELLDNPAVGLALMLAGLDRRSLDLVREGERRDERGARPPAYPAIPG